MTDLASTSTGTTATTDSGADRLDTTILVLNGPNLNLLGKRQPEIYGSETLADVEACCRAEAGSSGLGLAFHQSNAEHALIDWIHAYRVGSAGIVINAGAYTHTSIAILDALNTCEVPIVECHISNVHRREAFRHHSYLSDIAAGVICGLGIGGYAAAMTFAIINL